MGIFSVLTAPLRFAAHVAGSGMSRAATNAGASVSARMSMNSTRLQLQSSEAREMFDSKRLDKYFRLYHRYKKHILKYQVKKEGQVPKQIKKAYHKYRNDPQLLNKVLMHEIEHFTGYYKQLLQIITTIELTESDLILQKNASLIRDEDKLDELIEGISRAAADKKATLIESDMEQFTSFVMHEAKKQYNETKMEFKERKRATFGKKAVHGMKAFFGGITGINHIAHKVRKLSKKVFTHDIREFDKRFGNLRAEIASGHISNVTISELRFLMSNFVRINRYYHEIDTDMMLIVGKLFDDFDMIQKECVIPFYASVKNVKGADEIRKESEKLHGLHDELSKKLVKEEWEEKYVLQHLKKFVAGCRKALSNVEEVNKQVVHNLEQKMVFKPA